MATTNESSYFYRTLKIRTMRKCLLLALVAVTLFTAIDTFATTPVFPPIKKNETVARSYNIRIGLIRRDGTVITSGSADLSSFYAHDAKTGNYYYAEYNVIGGFFQLPAKIYGLPGGTYTFGADRGQGNWIAVSDKIVTITPDMVGPDGFVDILLEIAWEE